MAFIPHNLISISMHTYSVVSDDKVLNVPCCIVVIWLLCKYLKQSNGEVDNIVCLSCYWWMIDKYLHSNILVIFLNFITCQIFHMSILKYYQNFNQIIKKKTLLHFTAWIIAFRTQTIRCTKIVYIIYIYIWSNAWVWI